MLIQEFCEEDMDLVPLAPACDLVVSEVHGTKIVRAC